MSSTSPLVTNFFLSFFLWLTTILTFECPHAPVILGGNLQTTPSPHHNTHHKTLTGFCTTTSLLHIGDPITPIFLQNDSPLYHWLMCMSLETTFLPPTTTTALDSDYIDHRALLATIAQIGDLRGLCPRNSSTTPIIPTPRNHPPSSSPSQSPSYTSSS
jgi:hypothetical protein